MVRCTGALWSEKEERCYNTHICTDLRICSTPPERTAQLHCKNTHTSPGPPIASSPVTCCVCTSGLRDRRTPPGVSELEGAPAILPQDILTCLFR